MDTSITTSATDYSAEMATADSIVDMTDEERSAYDRLVAAGDGDAIGGATVFPASDPYQVIMFGWGDDEIPYGRVLLTADGRRLMPIDHGTALVRRSPVRLAAGRRLDRGSVIDLVDRLTGRGLDLLGRPGRPQYMPLHLHRLPDGGLIISDDMACIPGSAVATIWSPSDDPEALRRQIAEAMRGSPLDERPGMLDGLARTLAFGGSCGLLRAREEHGGVWRLTYDAEERRPDFAPATLTDDRDPHGSESIRSSMRGARGISRAVAQLAWEAAGCPQRGDIQIMPALGSGEAMLYEVSGYAILAGEPLDETPFVYLRGLAG